MRILDKDKIEIENKLQKMQSDRFSKEDLEKYYINEKKSLAEISRIYNCSGDTIKNKLINYEIPIRLRATFSKEDLERYYIDEKKSMVEISEIYGCSDVTIRSKLEKYEIPIRPQGAFLVSDDGKTLSSKRYSGEITWGEYGRETYYKRSDGLSMSENKNSSMYLGVHICENKEFLSKIINIVESMPSCNPGYDATCVKGKKVDVKCSCLIRNREWTFHTKNNKITDYFLMIAFDNREDLNVQHIWLVKGDAVIEKTTNHNSREFVVNEKYTVDISKGVRGLKRWRKYEIIDIYKLEEVQKVCNKFRNDDKCKIGVIDE